MKNFTSLFTILGLVIEISFTSFVNTSEENKSDDLENGFEKSNNIVVRGGRDYYSVDFSTFDAIEKLCNKKN